MGVGAAYEKGVPISAIRKVNTLTVAFFQRGTVVKWSEMKCCDVTYLNVK